MAEKRTGTQSRRERPVIRCLLLSVCWANDTSCRYPTITLQLRDPAFHEQPAEITYHYPLYFCPKNHSTAQAEHAARLKVQHWYSTGRSYTLILCNSHLKTHRSPENSQDSISWRFHKQNQACEVFSSSVTKLKCQKEGSTNLSSYRTHTILFFFFTK